MAVAVMATAALLFLPKQEVYYSYGSPPLIEDEGHYVLQNSLIQRDYLSSLEQKRLEGLRILEERRAAEEAARIAAEEEARRIEEARRQREQEASRAIRQQSNSPTIWGVAECIRKYESGGNYNAINTSSGASGAYQFLDTTWTYVTGLAPPARAYSAEIQDQAFIKLWNNGAGSYHWAVAPKCGY